MKVQSFCEEERRETLDRPKQWTRRNEEQVEPCDRSVPLRHWRRREEGVGSRAVRLSQPVVSCQRISVSSLRLCGGFEGLATGECLQFEVPLPGLRLWPGAKLVSWNVWSEFGMLKEAEAEASLRVFARMVLEVRCSSAEDEIS